MSLTLSQLREQLYESELKRGELLEVLASEREKNAENLKRLGAKVRELLMAKS